MKPTYALQGFTVRLYARGWYYAKTARKPEDWKGPYDTELGVAIAIAHQLRKELICRHARAGGARP